MFSVITDISKVERVKEYDIEIEKDDIEGLLVNFLSELIYLHEVKSVLFSDFDVEIEENEKTDSKKLTATAFGEDIDLEKHDMETAVKAVSYHELSIDPKGNIKILLDI